MQEIFFESIDYDQLTVANIDPKLLKIEPELYQSKWWDYRLLHVAQATYFFADSYLTAARRYFARNVDLDRAATYKPYPGKDLLAAPKQLRTAKGKLSFHRDGRPRMEPSPSKQTIAGVWKARQMADRHGIPYTFYCDTAIEYTEKGLWHRIPMPSHLYSTVIPKNQPWREESMVDYIVRRWKEYCAGTIVFSDNPYFSAARNQNTSDQIKHRVSLMTQIKHRPDPKLGLSHALYEAEVLIEKECIAFFGDHLVNKAKIYASY